MSERIRLAGLIPVGFQKATLTNSTAVGLNTTMIISTTLDISVETAGARMRCDGVDPTVSTGVLLSVGFHRLEGISSEQTFKLQRSAASTVVNIMGYRHPGDPIA